MTTPVTPARDGAATSITIPSTPAYTLSPNSRAHWRVKHRESQEVKQITALSCRDAEPVHGRVSLIWTIFLPKRGKVRDLDNLVPCMKPAMDALVQAGIIDGDGPDVVERIYADQIPWAKHHIDDGRMAVGILPAGEEPTR